MLFNSTVRLISKIVAVTAVLFAALGIAHAQDYLIVNTPSNVTKGVPFAFSVTAYDEFGDQDPTYIGPITLTSSDGTFTSNSTSGWVDGTQTYSGSLSTQPEQTITATDSNDPTIFGSSNGININGPPTHFVLTPSLMTVTAGTSFSVTVTAEDQYGNTVIADDDSVMLSSTDLTASFPASITLSSGVGTFTATLNTSPSQTFTATDGSITGTSAAITVQTATTHFTVSTTNTQTAGTPFNVTVTAKDKYGNTVTSYSGTVHLTSTDAHLVSPGDSGLTNGVKVFSVTLQTAGSQTVRATDTVTSTITGVVGIHVAVAAASKLVITSQPSGAVSQQTISPAVTVQVEDAYNNLVLTGKYVTATLTTPGAATLSGISSVTSDTGGTATFSNLSVDKVGTYTLTFSDVADDITSQSTPFTITPGPATHLSVTAPGTQAGTATTVSVTALDAAGNTATGYGGTVALTSSDTAAALAPLTNTLSDGVGTFAATFQKSGSPTVTATDTVASSITGTSSPITVTPLAATHLVVNGPPNVGAGSNFSINVTPEDQYGNLDTNYTGTVAITSSSAGTMPVNATFSGAALPFNVTLTAAGSQTVTATDIVSSAITGNTSVNVNAAGATTLAVSAPSTATAGTPINVTVTAEDSYGNTAVGYTGTVQLSSTDTSATFGNAAPLTNGVGTFAATFTKAGSPTVTATDTLTSTITGTSGTITVSGLAASKFAVVAASSEVAGSPVSFTVTPTDQYGNLDTNYTGTVTFTSTSGGTLPANSPVSGSTTNFSATLTAAGPQTITVTDINSTTIIGTSNTIAVTGGSATQLAVSAPSGATAGTSFQFTVTPEDQYGNLDTNYTGTAAFTSTSGGTLPANQLFSGAAIQLTATLNQSGNQTITATDTVTPAITGASGTITVATAPATHFSVSASPSSITSGASTTLTVTALDFLNNTVSGYTGTVHLTSSDGTAVLGADATLTNGAGTFSATFTKAGTPTVTATDTTSATITGNTTITVTPGAATTLAVSAPATATAGSPITVTVTAQDAGGNTATGYAGTVHLSSTDTAAILGADATLTNGVGTFTATLKTAGTTTVTATDTATSSITGSASVNVGAGGATTLVVSAPASATAGSPITVTVTAQDASGNTATGYTGTVHLTSTDTAAILGADATLTNGVGTFTATLKTAGTTTVTATDTATSSITGSASVNVAAGGATTLVVSAPASATAGSPITVTVTAQDASGNTVTGYAGTVHLSSTDTAAILGANATLTNGVGTFTATLKTAGTTTVTATDTVTPAITGSASVNVAAGGATTLVVSAPASATAGSPITVTVTATDTYGNIATGYTGTVHLTSTDPAAILGADAALTNGVGTFAATLKTAGTTTVTATDTATSSITGSASVNVAAGGATTLVVSAPASATAGSPITVTVTAQDASGNTATGYTGTVHLTSTDTAAILGADATLTNGVGTFTVTLKTAGITTVTATDTLTSTITGTSGTITVSGLAASKFAVVAASSEVAGSPVSFTVTPTDQYGNLDTNYTGTVTFTSTSGGTLPANSPVSGSTTNFSATLTAAGPQTITVTDVNSTTIIGTSNTIAVTGGSATQLAVSAPSGATAGTSFQFTVTPEDQYGNLDTNYTGTAAFTSTSTGTIPANQLFSGAAVQLTATLNQSGNQTITATDTVTPAITGISGTITVATAPATQFSVTASPSSIAAGGTTTVTVTALDSLSNTVTGYTGTVHLTSSDGTAVLGADATLTSGVGTFTATFTTAGTPTVTATDTVTTSITGTSSPITVTALTATQLVISTPTTAIAGTPFNFTVTPEDQYGNTDPTYNKTVTFTTTSVGKLLPAPYTFTGTAATLAATLNTAGSQTITAADNGTFTATSNNIAVGAGSGAQMLFTAQPTTTTAGQVISSPSGVSVQLEDSDGNPITTAGTPVTLTLTAGNNAALTAPAQANTDQNGIATFNNLSIAKAGTGYTLTASSSSIPSITSNAFDIVAGAATQVAFVQQPTAVASNQAIAPAVTVQIEDAYSNPVSTSGDNITIGLTNGNGATFTGTSPEATSSNGLATFADLSIDKTGSYTLTAADTSQPLLTAGTSANFMVTAGAPGKLVFGSVPATGTAGIPVGQLTVDIEDAAGNLVSTGDNSTLPVSILLATSTSQGTLLATPITVNAVSGEATFTSDIAFSLEGNYTLTATSSGVTAAISSTISITSPTATTTSLSPTTVFVGDPNASQLTIGLGGNTYVPGTTVSISGPNSSVTDLPISSTPSTSSTSFTVALTPEQIPEAGIYTVTLTIPSEPSAQTVTITMTALPLGPVQSIGAVPTASQDYIAGGLQLFSTPYDYQPSNLTTPDSSDYGLYLQEVDFSTFALSVGVPKLAVWDPTALAYDVSGEAAVGTGSENLADHLTLGQGYWGRFSFNASPLQAVALTMRGTTALATSEASKLDSKGRFQIAIKTGWNLIGDPFAEIEGAQPTGIALNNISVSYNGTEETLTAADANGVVSRFLYRYAPPTSGAAYQYVPVYPGNTDTTAQSTMSPSNGNLYPYVGYWVFSWTNCTLLVPQP